MAICVTNEGRNIKWKHILAIGLSAAMVMSTVLKEGTIVYANTEMDAISQGGKTFEAAGIQVEDGENPEGAFSNCTSLKKFDFSDVSRIEKLAFYNCSSLENIKIPDTANTIPEGAFYGCSNLKNIEIPENIKTIGKSAFTGCSEITTLKIPGSVTEIGETAFAKCIGLEELDIEEGVQTVAEAAFADCSNLKTIILPKSVSSFAKNFIIDFSPVKRNSSNYCEVRKKNYKVQNYSKIN